MADEAQAEIREMSYGSLLFRHIDRILNLTAKDFTNDDAAKLFAFKWSVKLLRSSIPEDIIDEDFKTKEEEIKFNGKIYSEKFEDVQSLYKLCIDFLARKGYLYKKVADGEYDD